MNMIFTKYLFHVIKGIATYIKFSGIPSDSYVTRVESI